MKYAYLALMAIFLVACNGADGTNTNDPSGAVTAEFGNDPSQGKMEEDVRLTSRGFDATDVTLKMGGSVTVFIDDARVDGHILTLDNTRLSEREMHQGQRLNLGFGKEGTFEIADETSKQTFTVTVLA